MIPRLSRSQVSRAIAVVALAALLLPLVGPPVEQALAQTVSVQGTLTLPDGATPVGSAWTYVHTANYSYSNSTYTSSDGAFAFYDLPSGSYVLEFYAYNGQYPDPSPITFTIASGETYSAGTVELQEPNVTGTLALPDETPVTSTWVYLFSSNYSYYKSTYTNAQGQFGFAVPSSGTYTLQISSNAVSGYLPPSDQMVTVSLPTATNLGTIEFVSPNVVVTLLDPLDAPVSGASITVRNASWTISKYSTTDTNGQASFYIGTSGTYYTEVYCWTCSYPTPDSASFSHTASGTTNLNLLLQTPDLYGKVTEPDGVTAVSGASVSIHTSNWLVYRYAQTDANGQFSAALPSNGSYVIDVWTWSSTYSNPAPTSFTYSGDTVYLDGTNGSEPIKLRQPSMRGRVVNPDGSAAQYANLYLHDSSYNYLSTAWGSTDMDGNFALQAVPTGASYTLEVTAPWNSQGILGPDPITGISLTEGSTDERYLDDPIDLVQAQKEISGTVARSNGNAVTDATVYAWRTNGSGYASDTVGSDGSYQLMVGPGTWEVSTYPSWANGAPDWGYYDGSEKVTFSQAYNVAEAATLDFTVTSFDATLTGTITYPDGSAPPVGDYVSISAWSQAGGGNWSQADASGRFSMRLPKGTFSLSIYSSNQTYGPPSVSPVSLKESETKDLGTVSFLAKNEFIEGKVLDQVGAPVANVSVNAWKTNGGGWAWTTADNDGNYSLNVTTGRWEVQAYPYSYGANSYVNLESPQTVVLETNQTLENVNFTLQAATATIQGTVQDADGNVVETMYGWANARPADAEEGADFWSLGGSISAGSFEINVPAGTFNVGASIWSQEYTARADAEVTVADGETVDGVVIELIPNDATITGSFKDEDGNVLTDVSGNVFAENGTGSYQWSNIEDGAYALTVSEGDWWLNYWINDSEYQNRPLEDSKVTVASEETVTLDITLEELDATITGLAIGPDGEPLPSAWVSAAKNFAGHQAEETGNWWDNQGRITDDEGRFSLAVASGAYFVTAFMPPELGYISPEKQQVTVPADGTIDVTLQFRESDARISGTVLLDGEPNEAFIWGWSEKGGYTETSTDDGSYALNVTQLDNWHVGAVYETDGAFYKSDEYVVSVGEESTVEQDLTLASSAIDLPATVTATFSTDETTSVELENGAEILIPQYAVLNEAEEVTLTVAPKAQIPTNGSAEPLNFGYDVTVRYAEGEQVGQEITDLNSNITVTLPVSEEDLDEVEATLDEVTPQYWDASTGTYQATTAPIVNDETNTVSFQTDHLTTFALTVVPSAGAADEIPVLTITSPEEGATLTTKSLSIEGTVSDPDAAVTMTLNDDPLGTVTVADDGSFAQTTTDLVLGENTVTVSASNQAGASNVSRTVTYRTGDGEEDTPDPNASGVARDLVALPGSGGPHVRIFSNGGDLTTSFFAYAPALRGKFSVVSADIDANGGEEIIAFPGAGFGPHVRVFDHSGELITEFFPYQASFRGGIDVKAADVTGDDVADLIVRPLTNGGPNVRVYSWNTETEAFELVDWFWGLNEQFRGETSLATADLTGDGVRDIVVAAQSGGGPNVRVYAYNAETEAFELVDWFWAYQEAYRGGVSLATADVDGDDVKELITWPKPNASPNVQVFKYDAANGTFARLGWFWAYEETARGGLTLKSADVDNDGQDELITAPLRGGPNVRVYAYNAETEAFELVDWFWAYQETYRGGVNLGIADVDRDSYPEIVALPTSNGGANLRLYEYDPETARFAIRDWTLAYSEGFRGPTAMTIADIDGDGGSEIVTSPLSGGGPNVRAYTWNGNGLGLETWFWGFASSFRFGVKTVASVSQEAYDAVQAETSAQIEQNMARMLSRFTNGFGHLRIAQ